MRSTAPTHPATPDQPVPEGTPSTAGPGPLRHRRALRGAAALLAAGALVGGTLVAPATAGAPTATTGAPAPEQADQARGGHGRDTVRGAVDALVRDDGFPAALASVRDERGRTRHLVAGVGDLTTGARVPTDGQVRFASNSKTFVAVAVMQLVGEGKIELDAPIGTYLPGLVDNRRDGAERVDGATITVRQVLQHTSGIPEYLDVLLSDGLSGVDAMIDTYVQPRALLDAAMTRPATFAPGSSWSYSNTNYVIAGLLVEEVTGRPLHEVLTQRVIERAGLRDTYLPAVGERVIRGRHPHGYHSDTPGGTLRDVTELDPSAAWAAGDVIGTPSDLIRLYTAILDGRLVGAAELAEMQKTVPVPAEWGPMRYGLGIAETALSCGGVAWGHGGDIFGYSTREGVTTDGRAASVAVTALPSSVSDPAAMQHVDAVIDTALCA
ncbi:serine hydrolase domain-containing protein [Cellulomonas algicola]|uniref:serine hydrolase domain-containing protein n=1 Tax=Cellulomonas algicola TaxID=2071633 RepID=UPI001C3FC59E|nr:serine hydrolase domain-containing protein [Cellulomonas algicola]